MHQLKSNLYQPMVKQTMFVVFRILVKGSSHIFSLPSFFLKIGTLLTSKWEVREWESGDVLGGKAILQPLPKDSKHNTSEWWRRVGAGWGGEVSAF